MASRVSDPAARGPGVTLTINGRQVEAYEGESLATALAMAGERICKLDRGGAPRGPFCNMGVCYDCLVQVHSSTAPQSARSVRACMTLVRDGLVVTTQQ